LEWLLNYQIKTNNSEKFGQPQKREKPVSKIVFQDSLEEKMLDKTTAIHAIQQSVCEIKNRLVALPSKLNPEIGKPSNSLGTIQLLENEIIGILIELSKMQLSPKAKNY
jgi:hypothetical protein